MEKGRLFDSLSGLHAYDSGCVDSGIKNEVLRDEVKEYLDNLSENEFRLTMTEFIREYYVSEKAVEKGYGIEDVAEFIDWLRDKMGIGI